MGTFRLIDHEADLGLELEAGTAEELFGEAARAMTGCHTDLAAVRAVETKRVDVEAANRTELLVRWLKEWLYLQNAQGFLLSEVTMIMLSDVRAVGEGRGEFRDALRHPPERELKAVTYHQARVAEDGGSWRASVVLDV